MEKDIDRLLHNHINLSNITIIYVYYYYGFMVDIFAK